jgi:methionyl-tRNA formyltransferase
VKDPSTAELLRESSVDVLLNVYSMFQVCPEVIRAARVSAFNLHPGRLPDVAGRNPVSAALYQGHEVHGVTLHEMTEEFDAGTIAFAQSFPIEERDTAGTLSAKCVRVGEQLLAQLVEATARGPDAVPRIGQDHSRRVYYGPEMPEDGRLTWTRTARAAVDFVRAYDFLPFASQWGHPTTFASGRKMGIARARRTHHACDAPPGTVRSAPKTAVEVATLDEWVLVERVHVDGSYVPACEVLRSGDVLVDDTGTAGGSP